MSSHFLTIEDRFSAKKKRFVRLSQGTSIKGFTVEDIKGVKFKMPENREEQVKIASFLSAIDNKIEKVNLQIGFMKNWKKGLLQQMFV